MRRRRLQIWPADARKKVLDEESDGIAPVAESDDETTVRTAIATAIERTKDEMNGSSPSGLAPKSKIRPPFQSQFENESSSGSLGDELKRRLSPEDAFQRASERGSLQ